MVSSTSASDQRPFRVLGLQQVAIGGLELEPLRHLWSGLLGIERTGTYESATENVIEDILEVGEGRGTVEIDLMQPFDTDSKPRVDGTPLNHIGLWIDDLPAAVTWLTEQGVRFTPGGIRPGAAGHDICFIHPKGNEATPYGGLGVLIELVQAPQDLLD
jgi:lactoylglutathione lyase